MNKSRFFLIRIDFLFMFQTNMCRNLILKKTTKINENLIALLWKTCYDIVMKKTFIKNERGFTKWERY